MPSAMLTWEDLLHFDSAIPQAKGEELIRDATARAARVAPCIRDQELSEDNATAARGIIRDAILRRNDAGSGALSAETEQAGPFSHTQSFDTRQPRRVLFWPSEIKELQEICADHSGAASSGAFTVDTVGFVGSHADTCSANFGAAYCSCGLVLTGFSYPLYGV